MILHQAKGLHASSQRGDVSIPRRPNVVGIVSGKGGVGKSTLAVNLAMACAKLGRRTLLIDGDAGLANADLLLGLIPRYTLADWCRGTITVEDSCVEHEEGLRLLLTGTGPEPAARLCRALRGEGGAELDAFLASQDWTFLDLGAGIGKDVLSLAEHCDLVWLVMTPEPTSLADAYTTARRLWARQPELRIEVVVNRVSDGDEGHRAWQSLRRLTQRFLDRDIALRGILPEDPAMGRAVAYQSPVVCAESGSRIARKLCFLAESLTEEGRSGALHRSPVDPQRDRMVAPTFPG